MVTDAIDEDPGLDVTEWEDVDRTVMTLPGGGLLLTQFMQHEPPPLIDDDVAGTGRARVRVAGRLRGPSEGDDEPLTRST
ncbi:hypothetical protein V3N99_17425 [Dermatophilaceae bacterium Soc4.6]